MTLALCQIWFAINAVATGKIIDMSILDGDLVLAIETVPFVQYQAQCRTSMTDGEWIDIEEPFVATATNTSFRLAVSEKECFFRVVQLVSESTTVPPPPPSPPPPPPEG